MKKLVLATFVVFSLLGAVLAQEEAAQEGPSGEELAASFAATLPPGWSLSAFNIEASENYGTTVEPEWFYRFNAPVALAADTFMDAGRDGSVTLLTPLGTAGETRTFYGLASAVRQRGDWLITFDLENNPTAGMGNPRDFFSGRLIVKGSEEEAAYRAQREADAAAANEAALAALAREEALQRKGARGRTRRGRARGRAARGAPPGRARSRRRAVGARRPDAGAGAGAAGASGGGGESEPRAAGARAPGRGEKPRRRRTPRLLGRYGVRRHGDLHGGLFRKSLPSPTASRRRRRSRRTRSSLTNRTASSPLSPP